MKKFMQFFKESTMELKFQPHIVWHFTSRKAERSIRKEGFKTGAELGVGEKSNSVFATQLDNSTEYNRHGGETVKIDIDISGMKIFDPRHLPAYEKHNVKCGYENGEIPHGYDAVAVYYVEDNERIFEIAMKAEVATRCMVKK